MRRLDRRTIAPFRQLRHCGRGVRRRSELGNFCSSCVGQLFNVPRSCSTIRTSPKIQNVRVTQISKTHMPDSSSFFLLSSLLFFSDCRHPLEESNKTTRDRSLLRPPTVQKLLLGEGKVNLVSAAVFSSYFYIRRMLIVPTAL